MPPLRVPSQYISVFRVLRDMAPPSFESLHTVVSTTRPVLGPDSLASAIEATGLLPEIGDPGKVLSALAGLVSLSRQADTTIEDIAAALAESTELETTAEDRAAFAGRIQQLLEAQAVRVLGKALELGSEHDKVFIGARVMTDVRPIFGDEVHVSPEGAVLLHTLKLEFIHLEGNASNVYVALDSEDLRKLKQAIERAEDKATSIRLMMQENGLPYLGMEE